MLDLIGFWFNVSVFTFFLLWTIIPTLGVLSKILVQAITEDSDLAVKAGDFFWESSYGYEKFLGRFEIHEFFALMAAILSGCLWLGVLAISHCAKNDWDTIAQVVAMWSTVLAPASGWVALVVVGWLATVFGGRRVWKLAQKVDKVLNKLDD